MAWNEFIGQTPETMCGKPVVIGTRLTVQFVLEQLAHGFSESDLLSAYPQLRHEHIQACLAYAAACLADEDTVFLTRAAG